MTAKLTYIDLFAGCGGLSLGLHNAGWKGLFAIEKSPDAFKTLEHNLIDNKQHFTWPSWLPKKNLEIDKVLEDYRDQLVKMQGKVDLVAGGPPCQGFSTAGLRKEDDIRNGLIGSYLKFIEYTKPKLIFFENVKGFTLEFKKHTASMQKLAKKKGKAYSQYVVETLESLGYSVKGQMIDFSKFGVPQKRVRFILVGIKNEILKRNNIDVGYFFDQLTTNKSDFLKSKGLPQNPKLFDAISDLLKENGLVPTPDRGSKFFSGKYSSAKSSYQRYLRRDTNISIPDSHSFPNHRTAVEQKFKFFLQAPRGKNLNSSIRKRFNVNKHVIIPLAAEAVAPTITTLPDDYIHYKEPRILTVREYARIQSFPDWYQFLGKYTTGGKQRVKEVPRYTQIGNAIPPLFGEQAGLVLNKMITSSL
jgi:DNA-methyltransferase (dcm)